MEGTSKEKFKILVPVDFSFESELALDWALEFGQVHKADIYLFNVHEGSTKNFRELDRINAEIMDKMKTIVINAMQRAEKQGINRNVDEVYRRVSNGKAWVEILKMTANINADLIVMGYRPKGRTWERVISKTPCTVMLARQKDPDFVMT